MVTQEKDKVLVVIQLTGGNDFMNTIIPYTNEHYFDARKKVVINPEETLPINDTLAFNPNMGPMKSLFDDGKIGIVQGIGYPNSVRSHFRAMDIMHTCEPDIVGTEGWLGRVIREIDPKGENPVTAVNIGQGLARALSAPNVSVASVADLETYGLLTNIHYWLRF